MSLAAWRRRFDLSLQALAHFIWQPTPESLLKEQETARAAELHRRHQRLVRIRQRLERLRGQLEPLVRDEQQLALTVQRLSLEGKEQEACNASLALEYLRKKQARLCDRLERGEALYQDKCQRFQEVKQQRLA